MNSGVVSLKRGDRPFVGKVILPGSKSYSNRALVMAAIAGSAGNSTILNCSDSDDTNLLRGGLTKLGVSIEERDGDHIVSGTLQPFKGELYIGPAGTTMRFLTALCAAIDGAEIVLTGTERMHQRPIGILVDALRDLGAEIEYLGTEGCPPLKINGKRLIGGEIEVDGSVSSQYFTALLLIAPLVEGELVIKVKGEQTSRSYIDITLQGLKEFGVTVENNQYKEYRISGDSEYQPSSYYVEGDGSGASYFWGGAALGEPGTKCRVYGVSSASLQGDVLFPRFLEQMGAKLTEGEEDGAPWIEVESTAELNGIEADLELLPDCAQTLAVVAASASGRTILTGLHTLRVKETDRIDAVVEELKKFGIQATGGEDYMEISGGVPAWNGEPVATYDDHRMAMSFASLVSKVEQFSISDPGVVNKSFPTFWEEISKLDIEVG